MAPDEPMRDTARSKGHRHTQSVKSKLQCRLIFGCSTVCCEPVYHQVPPAASSVIRTWLERSVQRLKRMTIRAGIPLARKLPTARGNIYTNISDLWRNVGFVYGSVPECWILYTSSCRFLRWDKWEKTPGHFQHAEESTVRKKGEPVSRLPFWLRLICLRT
jgi:hypothetical protein